MLADSKYAPLLVSRFRNAKKVDRRSWNFSCPICGDSKTKSSKARGYIFPYKNRLVYKCHNCGASLSFDAFLKSIDINLYQEYRRERLVSSRPSSDRCTELPPSPVNTSLSRMATVEDSSFITDRGAIPLCAADKDIQSLMIRRCIPTPMLNKYFFYVDDMFKFLHAVDPDKYRLTDRCYPRFVIVSYDRFNRISFFQLRRIIESDPLPKYMTVKIQPDAPKVFGLDRFRPNDPTYVLEGPIDSMFLDNALAVAGADLLTMAESMADVVFRPIIMYDNEPRSSIITSKISRAINAGYRVVVWDNNVARRSKDLNDFVLNCPGVDVEYEIDKMVCSGLRAKLKFNDWKKV